MVKHNAYKQAAPNFAYSFIKFEEKKNPPTRLLQPTRVLETWEYFLKSAVFFWSKLFSYFWRQKW